MTRKNPLVEVLEGITWNMPADRREGIDVLITHRGARNDLKTVPMREIARFDKGYVYVRKQEGDDGPDYEDEIPIPLHRVVRVVDGDGVVLYEKGSGEKKGGN
ncbi:MAG: hypothetical protein JW839_03220 [Candidatus Lokiarchaeota archaeon]|nr:hypothetical protein [Candidatus Lokiarchaeota archaeon]